MRGVLDTSLLEDIMSRYSVLYIPWIVLYEYLYGHKYLGKNIIDRKKAVEKLGQITGVTQDIILKAIEIDIDLCRKGMTIPFSDVLIAATTIVFNAELVTLDQKNCTRIPELKIYMPIPHK